MGELAEQNNGQKPAQSVRPPHQEWLERFWAWLGRKSLGTKITMTVIVLFLGWLFVQFTNSFTNSIDECGWDGILSRCFEESFFAGSKAQDGLVNQNESQKPIIGATNLTPAAATAPAISEAFMLTNDTVLRATAEPFADVVANVYAGDTVTETSVDQSDPLWLQVRTIDGQTGYVQRQYITLK